MKTLIGEAGGALAEGTPNEDATLQRAVNLAARLLSCDSAVVAAIENDAWRCRAAGGTVVLPYATTASLVADVEDLRDAQGEGRGRTWMAPDAQLTALRTHPLVAMPPRLRFMATAPLFNAGNQLWGVLMVADGAPRTPDAQTPAILADLAALTEQALRGCAAEDALRETTRMLKLAEHIAGVGHWRYDARTDRMDWSEEVFRIYGLDPQSHTPDLSTVYRFCYPGDVERLQRAVETALAEGTDYECERRIVRPDGTERVVASRGHVQRDAAGAVEGIFGVIQDITPRLHAERRLRESEERFQRSQAFANIGTWEWNIETSDLFWSERIAPLFGYNAGELETSYANFMAAVHPDDREAVATAVERCINEGEEYVIEHRVLWPDGTVRWLLEKGDVIRDLDGRPLRMLGVVQDITRAKEAELALKESEQRLKAAIENISDGFLLLDAQDRLVLWNERLAELYPKLRPWLKVGMPFEDLMRQAAETGQVVVPEGDAEAWLAERMAAHRRDEGVFEVRLDDGRWVRVAERRMPNGWCVGVRVDVTELRQAQEDAQKANRAKSEFLSSMSHELRTPLNAILGFTQLLLTNRRDPLSDMQGQYVDHILKAGEHLLELINDVLDLARIEAGKLTLSLEDFVPDALVAESLHIAETLAAPRRVTVIDGRRGPLPAIRADYTRLKQVLLNLLSNAVKYNRSGGSVTLAAEARDDGFVRFTVRDTGCGIPEERLPTLFEPFNRLGAEGTDVEGTGIGLTITKILVERMDGRIGVRSTLGEGSVFWVEIPAAQGTPRFKGRQRTLLPAPPSPSPDTAPVGKSRWLVLYVEDNPANLRLMEEICDDLGDVALISAHNAELGLAVARERKPDLILMDINLPGMDGLQAMTHLRDDPRTRDIPAIALSANAMQAAIKRAYDAGFRDYLTKPVVVDDLRMAIRRAVGEDPS